MFKFYVKDIVYFGGMGYNTRQHHFIRYYEFGFNELKSYYYNHKPRGLLEQHFLEGDNGTIQNASLNIPDLPWFEKVNRKFNAEYGLGPEYGVQYYGPAKLEKISLEAKRLDYCLKSISNNGYLPEKGGYPRGYFLKKDNNYKFHVVSGQHRIAALAYLGYDSIHLSFMPNYPRVIDISDCDSWPQVRNNQIKKEDAIKIFKSYWRNLDDLLPCFKKQ